MAKFPLIILTVANYVGVGQLQLALLFVWCSFLCHRQM